MLSQQMYSFLGFFSLLVWFLWDYTVHYVRIAYQFLSILVYLKACLGLLVVFVLCT